MSDKSPENKTETTELKNTGQQALADTSESFEGWRDFEITEQKTVIATGLAVFIFPHKDASKSRFLNTTTGNEGQPVYEGEIVRILTGTVKFLSPS